MSTSLRTRRPATGHQLNALRAAVLGANDGILSMAGLVIGVAGATSEAKPVLLAGIAGLTAGAISMALGEYVSVSSQRDAERASGSTEATNPLVAAIASALSFIVGGVLPVLVIVLSPISWRVWSTYVAVLIALALTGFLGAHFGGGRRSRAALRVVVGGAVGLLVTYLIGKAFGTQLA